MRGFFAQVVYAFPEYMYAVLSIGFGLGFSQNFCIPNNYSVLRVPFLPVLALALMDCPARYCKSFGITEGV